MSIDMIEKLRLQKITLPDNDRTKQYYQYLFRRMFREVLCYPPLLRRMKNFPLHETFEYHFYNNVFLTSVKQIQDSRIERYQLHIFDKKKDIIFKCILILKIDGTIWIDVNVIRNKYFHSGVFYRTEGTNVKVILSGLTKSLLTWD